MSSDDETPHRLVGRAGLVFAYVCFMVAIATIGGAIVVLPIAPKGKLFLVCALAVLISLFAFMAILTHMVLRFQTRDGHGPKPRTGLKTGRQKRSKRRSPTVHIGEDWH